MTIKEFFIKYNGVGVDYDGYYGFQCVDLYRQYCRDVLETEQSPSVSGAYQIWTTYRKEDFTRISNTPEGVPQLGDVVIWDKSASLGYGHVAIFDHGDVNSFVSFDQNFPLGSKTHFQNHNYQGVLGWLRPKNMDFTEIEINDQTKIDMGDPWGVMEVQAIRSTLNDQAANVEALNKALADQKLACSKELSENDANWQSKLDTANKNIKDLKDKLEKAKLSRVERYDERELIRLAFKKFVKRFRG